MKAQLWLKLQKSCCYSLYRLQPRQLSGRSLRAAEVVLVYAFAAADVVHGVPGGAFAVKLHSRRRGAEAGRGVELLKLLRAETREPRVSSFNYY